MRKAVFALGLALLLVVAGGVWATRTPATALAGTVQWVDLEGGYWQIRGSDGKIYIPLNLDRQWQVDGLEVEFEVVERPDMLGIHMGGTYVEIIAANGNRMNVIREGKIGLAVQQGEGGLVLVITNTGDQAIEFGEPYVIESYQDGNWVEVVPPGNWAWRMILYILEPGKSLTQPLFAIGEQGKYRVVKYYAPSGEDATYQVVAEFTVTE